MAQGDRNIFAFANRDSLKYKTSRTYGAGSVVLYTDGKFYEANDEILAGTVWEVGDTGATWSQVGGSDIPNWPVATGYKAGDLSYKDGAIWEANSDMGTVNFVEGTTGETWKVKVGVFNNRQFDDVKVIETQAGNNLVGSYIEPRTGVDMYIGGASRPMAGFYAERYRFSVGDTYIGEIDADMSNMEWNSTVPIQFKPEGSTSNTLVMESDQTVSYKPFTVTDSNPLIIEDNDSEGGQESWGIFNSSNALKLAYQTAGARDYDNATSNFSFTSGTFNIYNGEKRFYVSVNSEGKAIYNGTSNAGHYFGDGGNWRFAMKKNTNDYRFVPNSATSGSSNTRDIYLGESNNRWTTVYSINSLSVPSDKRLKDNFQTIPEKLLDLWIDNVDITSYTMELKKGKREAGVIAQKVIEVFDMAGLDWKEWQVIQLDDNGYYSAHYDQINLIENAAQRLKLKKLEALLAK